MKNYGANLELEQILLKQGFQDFTSKRDSLKGKRSFKLSKNSGKEIHFNYINIEVCHSIQKYEVRNKLDDNGLKALLLFFKLNSNELREISHDRTFEIADILKGLENITHELRQLTEFGMKPIRRKKLTRILDIYEGINLN